MDDSEARGAPQGPRHGGPRACESPPRRRRCSSARSGSAHPGGAKGPHDTPQRAGVGRAPAPGAGRRILWTRSRSSRSTSACTRPTRAARATTTRSTPGPPGGGRRRKLSRRSRRARFLSTDPPTRRLTARPRRSKGWPLGAATRRNRRPSRRAPRLNAASNSAPVRRRWRERKRMRPFAPARTSDGDPLPALLAAALQDELPSLRPHADEEAVGTLPSTVVRLERPLHR